MPPAFSILLGLLALGAPATPAAGGVRAGTQVAQVFEVEQPATAAGKSTPKKKPPRPPEPKTEADLWNTGDATAGGKAKAAEDKEEDIVEEEIPEEEVPEEGGGEEEDVWGEPEGDEVPAADEQPTDQKPEEYPEGPVLTGGPTKVQPQPKPQPKPQPETAGVAESAPGRPGAPAAASPEGGPSKGRGPEAAPAAPGEPAPVPSGQGTKIRYPSGTLADLEAVWQRRLLHLSQRDHELARHDLEQVLALSRELEIRNMPEHALVLLRQAEAAERAKDPERARRLLLAAAELAPDLPRVHRRLAWFEFRHQPLKPGPVFAALGRAWRANWANPLSTRRTLVNLGLVVTLGLALCAALYILVQFARHLRFFFHDFHHLFPRGVARLQTVLLGLLLLLVPVLFRMGLALLLLVMVLVTWLYQQRREQLAGVLAVLWLGVVPLMVLWTATAMQLPRTLAGVLYRVDREIAASADLARLNAHLLDHGDDYRVMAVLGGFYKRQGDYQRAEQYLRRALEAQGGSVELANNLGNVRFLNRDLEGAAELYNRALQLAPGTAAAYFNLSRVFYAKLQLDKAREQRQAAARIDEKQVRLWQKQAGTGLARHAVVDLPWPEDWLQHYAEAQPTPRSRRSAQVLWESWGGSATVQSFPYLAGGLVLLLGLLLLLRQRWQLSLPCSRCGRPVCRRCDRDLPDTNSCGQCFHAFRQREGVDARARIEKEIQVRQRRRRLDRLARMFSFLTPGVGQLLKERTWRGLLLLAIFMLVVTSLVSGGGPIVDPLDLGAGTDWLRLTGLGLLAALVYLWAVLDAFRQDG